MEANEEVLEFIKNNPNTNKVAISEATGINGLPLFNILKKLQTEHQITSQGEVPDMTFTAVVKETPAGDEETLLVIEPAAPIVAPSVEVNDKKRDEAIVVESTAPIVTPSTEIIADKQDVTEDKTPLEEKKEEPTKVTSPRNKDKYIFNAEEYGKGPLVRTIVSQYMIDHPSTTFKQLKEKFPDSLMKRFFVIEEVAKAKELSGTRDRYFFKPEHLIKTADKKTIAICSQWTATLILPFLEVARSLGYDIK